ncbi:MAG: DUF2279 domain-containing protein [Spirochaetota bacterium]|nr:DUF2279 domain-containing protein [Spirochaetota bacterium]
MKWIHAFIILFVFLFSNLFAQEEITVQIEEKQKKDYTAEYWLFGSVPALVIAWGIGTWGWGTATKWHFEGDGWGLEQDSYTGGADKWGHTWGIYLISRIGTYTFEWSGDSRTRAAIKGFIYGQFVGLGIEVGDGFGDTYGFAWGDMVWNLGGGLFALLLDLYPPIDNLLGFQMEYWPSEDHRNQKKEKWLEVTSDVSGQKYILALKLSGVPYIKDTFLKYFQIDFGYYTKGYWYNPSVDKYKTRHTYIGFAMNFSRLSESVFPKGGWRRAFSSFLKYYHPPVAYNPDALDNTLAGKTLIIPK